MEVAIAEQSAGAASYERSMDKCGGGMTGGVRGPARRVDVYLPAMRTLLRGWCRALSPTICRNRRTN
eukprot:480713-Pleurochrysis_carterae.AAC.1